MAAMGQWCRSELAGLGHFMTRERPDLVAEAIIAFVRKLGNSAMRASTDEVIE